ncbi:hypothetical protein K0017_01055 [Staphylococcus massiliensis]|uniref:hypothetical protein n=1 Tax=Staphylococcus massiliensis TaxID=555791 RepID=UPI001EE0ADE0|nr:hypothetical protein [Staphylococcus massiliensis]MCG3400908.1 hypothetical protein [Staphylococcus massiliensis]
MNFIILIALLTPVFYIYKLHQQNLTLNISRIRNTLLISMVSLTIGVLIKWFVFGITKSILIHILSGLIVGVVWAVLILITYFFFTKLKAIK